jgi:hypothetical protein
MVHSVALNSFQFPPPHSKRILFFCTVCAPIYYLLPVETFLIVNFVIWRNCACGHGFLHMWHAHGCVFTCFWTYTKYPLNVSVFLPFSVEQQFLQACAMANLAPPCAPPPPIPGWPFALPRSCFREMVRYMFFKSPRVDIKPALPHIKFHICTVS